MMFRATRIRILLVCVAFVLASPRVHAQGDGKEPPFMQNVFPPELVMKNAREIALRKEQRNAITAAIKQTQAETLDLQWGMQDAAAELMREMEKESIDEALALGAVERVMTIEGQVKRAHLRLLIRIKNQLDPGQQARLKVLRAGNE